MPELGSKAWLGSLIILGVAFTPALAANKTTQAAPAARVASPSPPPQAPNPSALQAAREVLIAMGADTRSVSPSDATLAQTVAQLGRSLPEAHPDWRPVMEQAVRDELRIYGERLFEGSALSYARVFTEPQLADILAFYKTPTGKLLAAQSGALARERQALSRQEGSALMSHMIANVCAKEVCAQKSTTPGPQPSPAGPHPAQ